MTKKNFTNIYFFIAIIEIVADLIDLRALVYFTKPLLMLSLLIFYYLHVKNELKLNDKIMILALIFAMLGDTFLMFGSELFLFGLGSFLITQICYIFLFNKPSRLNWVGRIILLIYVIFFVNLLKNKVPEGLFVPILFYSIVIGLMGMKAWERDVNQKSYFKVGIGASLFIVSDSFIAYNKFVQEIPVNTIWVMGTYVVAQYLIVMGFLNEHKKSDENKRITE
jgi:uncharacterized membrane protein YhhN